MKQLAALTLASLALVALAAASTPEATGQQAPVAGAAAERQGRSVGGSGAGVNQLGGGAGQANSIESGNPKRVSLEQEKRQIQKQMSAINILKSVMKIFFGNAQEKTETSNNLIAMLAKVLNIVRNSISNKSRGGGARTLRDHATEALSAGAAMVEGHINAMLNPNPVCSQRYICEASKAAVREGRELGVLMATLGGYTSNYLLEGGSQGPLWEASKLGRLSGTNEDECSKRYQCDMDKAVPMGASNRQS